MDDIDGEIDLTPRRHGAMMETLKQARTEAQRERAETMRRVRKAYVLTDRDEELEKALDDLLEDAVVAYDARDGKDGRPAGRLSEGRALGLLGESGAGKSRALARLFAKRPEFSASGAILVSVTTPSPCSLRLLGEEVLRALGYPLQREIQESQVWALVRKHLELRGTLFLHIDECQDVLDARGAPDIQYIRNTFKRVMQNPDWPTFLILSGLPRCKTLLDVDVQVHRRCNFVRFDNVTLEKDCETVRDALDQLATDKAGLSVDAIKVDEDDDDELIARLFHASLYQFGIALEYIHDAIKIALEERDEIRIELEKKGEAPPAEKHKLTVDHFANAYVKRTGCRPEMNVFTVEGDFTLLDVRKALDPNGELAEESEEEKEKKKKKAPKVERRK